MKLLIFIFVGALGLKAVNSADLSEAKRLEIQMGVLKEKLNNLIKSIPDSNGENLTTSSEICYQLSPINSDISQFSEALNKKAPQSPNDDFYNNLLKKLDAIDAEIKNTESFCRNNVQSVSPVAPNDYADLKGRLKNILRNLSRLKINIEYFPDFPRNDI